MTSVTAWRFRRGSWRRETANKQRPPPRRVAANVSHHSRTYLLYSRQPEFRCRCPRASEGTERRRLELRQQVDVILVHGHGALQRGVGPATAAKRDDIDARPFARGHVVG